MLRNNRGWFVKGHKSYNYWLGKKRSSETKKKISLVLKGRSLSEETKNKMRGRIPWNKNKKGTFKHSLKWHLEASKRTRGKNHWNWQGGISLINDRHDSQKYKEWRIAVYKKDNFTCQICGRRKVRGVEITLNADHIQPWSIYPELRFKVSNGRTLCVECHKQTPTYGNKPKVVQEVMSYDQAA